MSEYEPGDTVRFRDKNDGNEYIGKIIDHYEHDKLYEIQKVKLLEWTGEKPENLKETGVCSIYNIFEKIE